MCEDGILGGGREGGLGGLPEEEEALLDEKKRFFRVQAQNLRTQPSSLGHHASLLLTGCW